MSQEAIQILQVVIPTAVPLAAFGITWKLLYSSICEAKTQIKETNEEVEIVRLKLQEHLLDFHKEELYEDEKWRSYIT